MLLRVLTADYTNLVLLFRCIITIPLLQQSNILKMSNSFAIPYFNPKRTTKNKFIIIFFNFRSKPIIVINIPIGTF